MVQTGTDYGPYLANEPSPLHTTTIVDRCTEKLMDDWNKMRTNVRTRPWPNRCSSCHDTALQGTRPCCCAGLRPACTRQGCAVVCMCAFPRPCLAMHARGHTMLE